MKLYTEKQLREAFEAGFKRGYSGYPNTENWTQPKIDNFISSLTPIELPSDGLIKKEATTQMEEWSGSGCEEEIFAFIKCAKWMKEQILKQD